MFFLIDPFVSTSTPMVTITFWFECSLFEQEFCNLLDVSFKGILATMMLLPNSDASYKRLHGRDSGLPFGQNIVSYI